MEKVWTAVLGVNNSNINDLPYLDGMTKESFLYLKETY